MGAPHDIELTPGTRLLDRYIVADRFDGGGMATIYRANDERLSRIVCAKVLRTTLVEGSGSTSGRALYRATYTHFLQEARALSQLQHPNTLRIYDFGYVGAPGLPEAERAPFHISEFLSGGNLESVVRDHGPFTEQEAADVVERIAGALAEAHAYGIVHRDIKPSNILFAEVGGERFPKLADFGIARTPVPLGARASEDHAPLTLCSPRWASPEQLSGGIEGPATDVFALGLVLHFMLTGRPAFDVPRIRDTFVPRIVDDDFTIRTIRAAGLRAPMEAALLGCLRVSSAQRFRDPGSFAAAVRAAVATASGPAQGAHGSTLASTIAPVPRAAPPKRAEPGAAKDGPFRIEVVTELADLTFTTAVAETRVRISFQPMSERVNVRSLTGFVRRAGARASTATLLDADTELELVSANQTVRLAGRVSFGVRTAEGTRFVVDGRPVLVPSTQASQAVALYVSGAAGHAPQVVIVARR